MPTPTKPDVKGNLKEATEILDCMNVDDEKLQKIADVISEKIKNDPNIKKVIEALSASLKEEDPKQIITMMQKLLEHDDIMPLIEQILSALGNNPEIIENI
ncbi:MAG: hypothetical protein Q6373_007560, partial [Candidatus Sigynarchaeota archaeon]